MYAVIFRAEINKPDQNYSDMALALRELALQQFGCTEFVATSENGYEIAISYWPNLDSIQSWKNHPLHKEAQELGKSKWYKSYQVQVVELLCEYGR